MDLVNGVYDRVPENPFGTKMNYISFGPSDGGEDDTECITGIRVTCQIDIWSRAVGQMECKRLVDLVRRTLHRKPLKFETNALVDIWVEVTRVVRDPDGLTSHGIVTVTAIIEEPN
ncbi:hypothetical protein FHU14_004488 [Mesorhizobium sp. RMAD-H1]|nr:hypothetical protein [Mesorhizobium sp. RMAD-H1]